MDGTPPPPPPPLPPQPDNAVKARKRSGPRSRSSPYKGVTQYRRTEKWEAHIWIPTTSRCKGHQRHLGSYDTAEDAARCFDRATIHVRGKDEELNFPVEDYADDTFMQLHAKTEKFKFLELLRAQFAIESMASSSSKGKHHSHIPSRRKNQRPQSARTDDDDDVEDPEYSTRAKTKRRAVPSVPGASGSGSQSEFAAPHRTTLPSRTTTTARILFQQHQPSPRTPPGHSMVQSMATGATAAVLPPRSTPGSISSLHQGRLVGLVSEDTARMAIRKLSNYPTQRVQPKHHSLEEEDEEEDGDDGEEARYTVGVVPRAPHRLFPPPPIDQGWMSSTRMTPKTRSMETTPAGVASNLNLHIGINKNTTPTLSFASTLAGLPIAPAAAPAVLPSRFIGTAFGTASTTGFVLTSSGTTPSLPSVYNGINLQETAGVSNPYMVQENTFHLPSLLATAGGRSNAGSGGGGSNGGDGSGGSTGSGHDALDPTADELLAGIQMITGQHEAASPQEYKDWLCNSPIEVAPSPKV